MKVSVNVVKPVFEPVELKLMFETEEELSVFRQLMWHDSSVPDLVFKRHDGNRKTLQDLMHNVHCSMAVL